MDIKKTFDLADTELTFNLPKLIVSHRNDGIAYLHRLNENALGMTLFDSCLCLGDLDRSPCQAVAVMQLDLCRCRIQTQRGGDQTLQLIVIDLNSQKNDRRQFVRLHHCEARLQIVENILLIEVYSRIMRGDDRDEMIN